MEELHKKIGLEELTIRRCKLRWFWHVELSSSNWIRCINLGNERNIGMPKKTWLRPYLSVSRIPEQSWMEIIFELRTILEVVQEM